ncbi:hypothetical protein [Modestobacter sp. SYSU DS0290]
MDRVDRRVLSAWFHLWRIEHLELHSALPVEIAEERLAVDVSWRRRRTWVGGDPAPVDLVGRVRRRRVRVCALPRTVRQNSWTPVLRGRIAPHEPAGSRLVARIGWPPSVRVLTVCWLVLAACLLVAGLVATGVSLANGEGVGGLLYPVLAGTVMVGWGVALTWYGGTRGWATADQLLAWAEGALEVQSVARAPRGGGAAGSGHALGG